MSLNFAIIVAGELLFAFVRGPMAEFQNIKDVPLKFCYRALQWYKASAVFVAARPWRASLADRGRMSAAVESAATGDCLWQTSVYCFASLHFYYPLYKIFLENWQW